MHMHHLNWLAILVAAVSTMAAGFLWYSPMLFAKPWMREMGCDPNDKARVQEMQKRAGPAYTGSFVASLISAFVLALFLHWVHGEGVHVGVLTRFHVWLGFVATAQLTGALFTKQGMKLFAINTGNQLVCYLAMGAILGGLAITERAGYLPRDLSKKEAMSWSASSASGNLGLFQKACGRASKTSNCASTPARR